MMHSFLAMKSLDSGVGIAILCAWCQTNMCKEGVWLPAPPTLEPNQLPCEGACPDCFRQHAHAILEYRNRLRARRKMTDSLSSPHSSSTATSSEAVLQETVHPYSAMDTDTEV